MPLVYEELRRMARRYTQWEQQGITLQATALVNETFLRLVAVSGLTGQARSWRHIPSHLGDPRASAVIHRGGS